MELQELTQAMDDLVRAKGWYQPQSLHPQTPRNIAISLSLETAEVLEHFQWTDSVQNREALASELADVTLYLLQLAHISGINLEEAVLQKIALNYQRTWDQNPAGPTGQS